MRAEAKAAGRLRVGRGEPSRKLTILSILPRRPAGGPRSTTPRWWDPEAANLQRSIAPCLQRKVEPKTMRCRGPRGTTAAEATCAADRAAAPSPCSAGGLAGAQTRRKHGLILGRLDAARRRYQAVARRVGVATGVTVGVARPGPLRLVKKEVPRQATGHGLSRTLRVAPGRALLASTRCSLSPLRASRPRRPTGVGRAPGDPSPPPLIGRASFGIGDRSGRRPALATG